MAVTTSERPIPTGEGLTFEKVWEMFQETREQMREADRKSQEDFKQMREQMKETDKRIGYLDNRFGELAEHLVAPNIKEKFNKLGFNFTRASLDCEFEDPVTRQPLAEFDIMLENGDVVIAVEVKSKPKQKDVDAYVKKMEGLRHWFKPKGDKRRFQGAIAGAIMNEAIRSYILQHGFYAIEQTGDTVMINVPEQNKIREW